MLSWKLFPGRPWLAEPFRMYSQSNSRVAGDGSEQRGSPGGDYPRLQAAGCAGAVDPASGGEGLASVTGHQKRLNGRIEASEGWRFNLGNYILNAARFL